MLPWEFTAFAKSSNMVKVTCPGGSGGQGRLPGGSNALESLRCTVVGQAKKGNSVFD